MFIGASNQRFTPLIPPGDRCPLMRHRARENTIPIQIGFILLGALSTFGVE